MGPPTTPGNRNVKTFSGLPVPATGTRHASLANRNLTRTLSEIAAAAPVKLVSGDLSGSSEAAKKEKLRVQPTRAPSSRIAAQRHVDSPESAGNASSRSALPTSSSSKPKPPKDTAPTLDVLKHCTVFVDVRTAEGDDDAADLFVEMLRGLGARILTRMSTRLTHIIFKSGLPSTVAKYRMLREPRPAVVGIGWVVECAEKRERVDESRFAVDLDTADTKVCSPHFVVTFILTPSQQKRRTDGPLNPVPHRRLYTGDGPEGEDEDDESLNNNGFTAEEESFLEFEFEKSIVGVNLPPNGNTNGNSRKSVGGKRKSVVPSPKVKNVLSMSDVAVSESRPTTTQKEIADFFTTKRRVASSGHRPRFGSPLREFSLPPDEDEELATTSAEPVPDADAMEL
ncbi:hypothetical protein BKA62DRAFT_617813 [Auriculariales sp. MPI-PUGE-AT-0066]|nr:hypothetical protein BKA62DRAFT_617813 [Auriculariales sp. MPI-PUGE-AT-0066]